MARKTAKIARKIARYLRRAGFEVRTDHSDKTESAYCWVEREGWSIQIRVSAHLPENVWFHSTQVEACARDNPREIAIYVVELFEQRYNDRA